MLLYHVYILQLQSTYTYSSCERNSYINDIYLQNASLYTHKLYENYQ